MRARVVAIAVFVLLAACTEVTVETTTLSGGTVGPPSENPATAVIDAAAADICAAHAWSGIPQPAAFIDEAAELEVEEAALAAAVRRTCPGALYEPLSRAEADWCGEGLSFGRNFFLVVEAGVDLGIDSFTVVEPALIAKAAGRSADLSDYEIELLTAELQTMTESARFERDWAEACRSTF